MQSSKRHPYIFSGKCLGNRFSERGLPHSRRTIKTEDWRLQIAFQLKNGKVFKYPVLHLIQSEMVIIQNIPGIYQIKVIVCVIAPWQVKQSLDVIHLHRIFCCCGIKTMKLAQLLPEGFLHIIAPEFQLSLFPVLFYLLVRRVTPKLILNGLHLLMEQEFTLLLVEVDLYLRLQFIFKLKNLDLLNQIFKQCIAPVTQTVYFQQFLFVLDLNVGIGTDKVYKIGAVLYILDSE